MRNNAKTKNKKSDEKKPNQGFTLVEVILVLAISSMMLIGLIGASFSTISRQRYNDSVRGYAEFLRSIYNEVINPESLGNAVPDTPDYSIGNSSSEAILGKVVVFGANGDSSKVYTATLVGNSNINRGTDVSFLQSITDVTTGDRPDPARTNTTIFCGDVDDGIHTPRPSSVESYTLLWEAHLQQVENPSADPPTSFVDDFSGTMIIARTPSSATVHTAFASDLVLDDIEENCEAANEQLKQALYEQHERIVSNRPNSDQPFNVYSPTSMCIVSDNSAVFREVQIAADGRNTSAIWIRPTDDGENRCEANE